MGGAAANRIPCLLTRRPHRMVDRWNAVLQVCSIFVSKRVFRKSPRGNLRHGHCAKRFAWPWKTSLISRPWISSGSRSTAAARAWALACGNRVVIGDHDEIESA